jgi:glycosyltransferase involved in cell wall biosynthesis
VIVRLISKLSKIKIEMKLLIGASPSKIFHLKEFVKSLEKLGVKTKLVIDTDIYTGFPSKKISNWFETKKKFNKLISEFEPDIIFVDRQHTLFDIAAVESKIPVFVHLRGDYWSEIKWAKETLYKGFVRKFVIKIKEKRAEKCFNDSTVILPICNYLENIVKNHYPNKNTHVLQSGITSSRWYSTTGMNLKHPCVGILQGAVIWGKTKEMLILEKVIKSLPNVMFYWAGDGPYRKKVLEKLEKFNNFKWLGPLEYPNKTREFLSEIDIYGLVSGIDMSPLTVQEAQLMKKPVIVSNVGGVNELIIDNETGFLINKGNPDEWIKKISLLIESKELRDTMGNKGRKFVEDNFSWDIIAEKFLKFIKEKNYHK